MAGNRDKFDSRANRNTNDIYACYLYFISIWLDLSLVVCCSFIYQWVGTSSGVFFL